jgi:hypothetical protein
MLIDLMFLFDDSLGRLNDVMVIETALRDPLWASKPTTVCIYVCVYFIIMCVCVHVRVFLHDPLWASMSSSVNMYVWLNVCELLYSIPTAQKPYNQWMTTYVHVCVLLFYYLCILLRFPYCTRKKCNWMTSTPRFY